MKAETPAEGVVNLGHGSGGTLSRDLIEQHILPRLANPVLEGLADGALLEAEGTLAFTTDSYVVHPIEFPGGDIGELAVNGTVNDLAMCGARPQYLSLGLILEEGLPFETLDRILDSVARAAARAQVQVVTGDTKVVERGKADRLYINTTGLGRKESASPLEANRIQVGDAIVCSGPIAAHGIAIMSLREGLAFQHSIHSDTAPLQAPALDLLAQLGGRVRCMRDATRGGVATVLNELAQSCRLGALVRERDLPLEAQVKNACELLGLDPLYVANEGVFLAVVAAEAAEEAVACLRRHAVGRQACTIGRFDEQAPGKVLFQSAIGGKRVMGMLAGDQLPRIC
jgi:hydrogenase expression/formation protein HypE